MRRGVLALALLALLPAAARAQSLADYDYTNLEFRGAGAALGYIWPTKVAATPVLSLRADLGYLGPGVRIVPSLSYWSSDFRRSELDRLATRIDALPALRQANVTLTGADLGPVRWRDLALDVDAQYVVTTPSGVLAYGGAGLGVHLLRGQGAAIQGTFVQDLLDSFAPAVTLLGGAEYRVGERLRVSGELRLTAMGDVQYAGIRLGGMIMAPGHRDTPAPPPAGGKP